jgi:hypothetical protein
MYVTVIGWHKPTLLRITGLSFIFPMLAVAMFTDTFAMLTQQQLAFFEHSTQVMRTNIQRNLNTLFC